MLDYDNNKYSAFLRSSSKRQSIDISDDINQKGKVITKISIAILLTYGVKY